MVAENQLEKTGVRRKNSETAKNEGRFLGTQLCCKSIIVPRLEGGRGLLLIEDCINQTRIE